MLIHLARFGKQIYAEAFWDTVHGIHSRDVFKEMPPEIQTQVDAVLAWSEAHEAVLVDETVKYERRMEVDRQIATLNKVRAGLLK